MADHDRLDKREISESPFQTLSKQVASLKVQDETSASQEAVDNEPKVVERIESLCINCEDNVLSSKKY